MWCLCPRDGGKPFSETSAGNWVLYSTPWPSRKNARFSKGISCRTTCTSVSHTPEARGRLGDRLSEREERYRHRQDVRQGEKLFRRALLGPRLRGVHRRLRTGAGAQIHPRARTRGWQPRTVLNRKEGAQRATPNHWTDRL